MISSASLRSADSVSAAAGLGSVPAVRHTFGISLATSADKDVRLPARVLKDADRVECHENAMKSVTSLAGFAGRDRRPEDRKKRNPQ
jgi:hypothetical protein